MARRARITTTSTRTFKILLQPWALIKFARFENLIQNKKAVPAKFFLFKLVSQEIRTKFEIITKYVIHMLRLLAKRFISLDPKEPVAVPQSATAKQTRKPRRHVWFNQQNPQISSAEVQAQEAENRRLEAEREQRLAVKSLFGRQLNEAHIPLVSALLSSW